MNNIEDIKQIINSPSFDQIERIKMILENNLVVYENTLSNLKEDLKTLEFMKQLYEKKKTISN
ncbi:MAG: hypothetical protein JXB00_09460 [Bacteroidales bacterium]|nr:hypothetical protein [Bacteroidales bacterium]